MVQHSLWDEVQAIVAAVVGGARYGVKIRIPHALVMTVLFRRDLTSKEKIRSVLKLTMEHASNLAMFAAIYKVSHSSCVWTFLVPVPSDQQCAIRPRWLS